MSQQEQRRKQGRKKYTYNFRGLSLGLLEGHLKTGGTTRYNQPPPSGLFSGLSSLWGPKLLPRGLSAGLPEARVPMERSQHPPFPMVAPRPFPSHRSQLGSSHGKSAPSPTMLPSSWGPEALGSIPRSVKVAPLCLSAPHSGRQGLNHSAANFEVLGGDPHLRRSALVLLGTSCPGHSSGDAGALLGAPS